MYPNPSLGAPQHPVQAGAWDVATLGRDPDGKRGTRVLEGELDRSLRTQMTSKYWDGFSALGQVCDHDESTAHVRGLRSVTV